MAMNVVSAIILFILGLMIAPLVGVAVGAFCGWVVGTFWPSTMPQGMTALGLGAMAPYQYGAFLGFSGGFFKSITTVNKS
jgi:hypothetical protein